MRRALWLSSGVIVWAVHFVAIYGFTGLACARGWHAVLPWGVGGATLIAAAIAVMLLARALPRRAAFEDALVAGLAAFALLAIVWEGISILVVAPCVAR